VTAGTLILLAVATPLVGALGIAATGASPNRREAVTLVAAVSLFAVVLSILRLSLAGAPVAVGLIEPLPGLPIAFEVEPLGMTFALVASGLWIVNSVYSIGYMRGNDEPHQTRFYVCFAVALGSTMGVAFADNLFTLFLFYEALTLSTYPLVTHHGDLEARKAGRTYLGLLLGTSIGLLLLAILVTWALAGTVEFRPGGVMAAQIAPATGSLLLILFMFGVGKAALMPFHRWLPAAMVAPTPVSALLHAVAVVKAGVFSVVKIVVYTVGLDYLHQLWSAQLLLYVAGFTVLAASIVALRQDNLKRRLAYSTVSQLSYVVIGALLGTAMGVVGGAMHIAMHAFGKITLFFCAGAIYTAAHKTEISQMNGLGRVMPVTLGAFCVGALSVIGLPPFGGSWSKFFLALGAADAGQLFFVAVLMASTLLNVAYLLAPVARGFFWPSAPDQAAALHEAPLACLAPIVVTAAGCLALFFAGDWLYELLLPIAGGAR
jgi:multicomponent Na+:H+ antiporter subunit D